MLTGTIKVAVALAAVLLTAAAASAQISYTFTSGPVGDGFNWPPSPPGLLPIQTDTSNTTFTTPDGVFFHNTIGNNLFFDNNYILPDQATGSTGIVGEAVWGNPKQIGGSSTIETVIIDLGGPVNSVGFDFAWAVAGFDAPDFLEVFVGDSAGEGEFVDFFLADQFEAGGAFGGFDGRSGRIEFSVDSLLDDYDITLDVITNVDIFVDQVSTLGAVGEFAIDNFDTDGGAGETNGSNVFTTINGGEIVLADGATLTLNSLRTPGGTETRTIEVTNGGSADTTFSTHLDPAGDLDDPGQVSGAVIEAGQTIQTPVIATLDQNSVSGEYESLVTVINDINTADPDNTVNLRIRLHDSVRLSDDSGLIVDPAVDNGIFIANAAAGSDPGEGPLRASAKVTTTTTTGNGIFVTGLRVGDLLNAGEMLNGTVVTAGLLSGAYSGTFSVEMDMLSDSGVFLADATAVPPIVWGIDFVLTDATSTVKGLLAGEAFSDKALAINNSRTAAAIVGGVSTSDQSVGMQFAINPEEGGLATAMILGDAVDVNFGGSGTSVDMYVLQLTYAQDNLPTGTDPQGLRVLFFDTASSAWVDAVGFNSDRGTGDRLFLGSYFDYLAATDGLLDATDLSAYGVDQINGHIWAVLDHNSTFGGGVLVPEPISAALWGLGLLALAGRQRRRA